MLPWAARLNKHRLRQKSLHFNNYFSSVSKIDALEYLRVPRCTSDEIFNTFFSCVKNCSCLSKWPNKTSRASRSDYERMPKARWRCWSSKHELREPSMPSMLQKFNYFFLDEEGGAWQLFFLKCWQRFQFGSVRWKHNFRLQHLSRIKDRLS